MPGQNMQQSAPGPELEGPSGDKPPSQPWRTEGLPKKESPKRRQNWILTAILLRGYLVFFSVLTMQDQMNGPQTIAYTEFKTQVAAKNVGEVFARGSTIEGSLKNAAPLPGQKDRT